MSTPNPELLRSLGRLVRGLSALFWGLPTALITGVGTASAGWFNNLNVLPTLPALAATGVLLFGLWQIGSFQKQERPWRSALDRAKLLALVNFGLCPFLYWFNRMPGHPFFLVVVAILVLSSLLFLFNLNLVLARLGAMLPDETLRQETRQFTALNRGLLAGMLLLAAIFLILTRTTDLLPQWHKLIERLPILFVLTDVVERFGFLIFVLLILFPLSMTMALIWKTKEVILQSVFDERR